MNDIILDDFLSSYIEAALWSSVDSEQNCPLDENYGPEHLSPELQERMQQDCQMFIIAAGSLVEGCRGSYALAGHDFWLTRNGHGAGFWGGDWPLNGDLLTQVSVSEPFGPFTLCVGDDGLLYGYDGE